MLNRWQRTIVDLRGNVVPYAQLQILREQTQSAPTIYRDKAGTEVIPNAIVTANQNGYAYFYAPADLYRIRSTQPSIDWRDVDVGSAAAQQLAQQALDNALPTYATKADMQADTGQPVDTMARVVNDGVEDNNGFYLWDGAAWKRTSLQPADASDVRQIEDQVDHAVDILIPDTLRRSVESASGGRRTVIYTDKGQPSIMYVFPAFNLQDVAPGGELGTGVHPAFLFNGVRASEILVGAYPAYEKDGEALSIPGVDPRVSINFNTARARCRANGPGWDIMSNWDWAAIALWCMANGYQPGGNTAYGVWHTKRWESGIRQDGDIPGRTEGSARTLTGSGPASWSHDATPAGIYDLVGNAWEWNSGLILQDNVFHVAPDNGAYEDHDYIDTAYEATAVGTFATRPYVDPPEMLRQALAVPTTGVAPVGYFYVNASGERVPIRGGDWRDGSHAGLGALALNAGRTNSSAGLGFRSRFRAL